MLLCQVLVSPATIFDIITFKNYSETYTSNHLSFLMNEGAMKELIFRDLLLDNALLLLHLLLSFWPVINQLIFVFLNIKFNITWPMKFLQKNCYFLQDSDQRPLCNLILKC